jgi:hypothetical protein
MAMALVVVPGVASARPPEAAHVPLAQTLQGPAKDAYSSAGLLFNNGDFAGAFTKYRAAYDLAKDPRLLYNMALCEKNIRHYAQMQVLLLRYERESGPTLSAEHKDAVEGALAAIRACRSRKADGEGKAAKLTERAVGAGRDRGNADPFGYAHA